MSAVLKKTAYNMMIYEVRDYCCGLIDTQARMISQNRGGLPIFLADLGVAVADGIERYGLAGFAPGDVIAMNQGEVCGQHLNNVVVYSPCFHNGELVGFAANRAHWVDIGGVRQGFGSYGSSDIYAEGIQMRSLKIYEAGKRNETLWQIIRDNTRYPDAALGDLRARGRTLLIIEHHMPFVMALCDKIVVMDHGEKIAEGSPEAIRTDPRVIAALLGRAERGSGDARA